MVRNRKESGKHLKTKWLQKTELRWNHKKKLIWGMWRGSGDNDGSLRNWEKRWRDRDFRYLFYLLWDYGSKCHYKKKHFKNEYNWDIFIYFYLPHKNFKRTWVLHPRTTQAFLCSYCEWFLCIFQSQFLFCNFFQKYKIFSLCHPCSLFYFFCCII